MHIAKTSRVGTQNQCRCALARIICTLGLVLFSCTGSLVMAQTTQPLEWSEILVEGLLGSTANSFEDYIGIDDNSKRLLIHDFDNNGYPDCVYIGRPTDASSDAEPSIRKLFQYPTGWIYGRFWNREQDGIPINFTAGATGDFDGDGWEDIILVGVDDVQPRLLKNTGNLDPASQWAEFDGFIDVSASSLPTFYIGERNFGDVTVGDINGDGHLDIYMLASADSDTYETDYLLLNNGDGTFDDDTEDVMGFIRSRTAVGTRVELVDFDGNGHLDIVKTSLGFNATPWNDTGVFILYNDGTTIGSDWQKLSTSSAVQDFAVGRVDGDFLMDIYIASTGPDEWVEHSFMFLGQHSLSYTPVTNAGAMGSSDRVWLTDLDLDGQGDVILSNTSGGSCDGAGSAHILQFEEDGFVDHHPEGLGGGWADAFLDIHVQDIDLDGLPDVFIARCTGLELLKGDNCHVVASTGDTDGDGLFDGCDPCPYNASPDCAGDYEMPYISLEHAVSRQWMEMALASIRHDFSRPTVHARNLFHVSAVMWDAWAAFDDASTPYLLGQTVDGIGCDFLDFPVDPDPVLMAKERDKAISYAAYRILNHRFTLAPGWGGLEQAYALHMERLGYNPSFESTDYSAGDGAALGNAIALCYLDLGSQDGSNEVGDYASQHYVPVNPAIILSNYSYDIPEDMNRWQPLEFAVFEDQSSNILESVTPPFVTPEWGNVTPFALKDEQATYHTRDGNTYRMFLDPGPPPLWDEEGSVISDRYAHSFAMTAAWSSHLDPADPTMWDISPASIGNRESLPETYEEALEFYNFEEGGSESPGHAVNPKTGQPYAPNMVPRADYARVLAEYWADGPESETPPGHWFTILNYVMDQPEFEPRYAGQGDVLDMLEWETKAYFSLGGAMHDAAVATWSIKGWYDFIQPISAIRAMGELGQRSEPFGPNYHPGGLPLIDGFIEMSPEGSEGQGPFIRAWNGFCDDQYYFCGVSYPWGVQWNKARKWLSYQPQLFVTPPFAGYVSGHSTFSRAAAEVLTHVTGDAFFPGGMGTFSAPQTEFLGFDLGPSVDVNLQWATYRDAADESALSRIWGGIHPFVDDYPARQNGIVIGQQAAAMADTYFLGNTLGCMDPLACDYDPMATLPASCQYPTDQYFIPEVIGQPVIVPCSGETPPDGYVAAGITCFLSAVEGSDACMLNWSSGCQQSYDDCFYADYGCTDPMMCHFDDGAEIDDGSCQTPEYWLLPEDVYGPAIPYCGPLSDMPDGYGVGLYSCVYEVALNDNYCLTNSWDQTCANQYAACACDFPASEDNEPPQLVPDSANFFDEPLVVYCSEYYAGIFDDIVDEIASEIEVIDECPETVSLTKSHAFQPGCGTTGGLSVSLIYTDFQGQATLFQTSVYIIDPILPTISASAEMYFEVGSDGYSNLDEFFALAASQPGFEGGTLQYEDACGSAEFDWYENSVGFTEEGTFYRHISLVATDECGNAIGSGTTVYFSELPSDCGWWIPQTVGAGPAEFSCDGPAGYALAPNQFCANAIIESDSYCVDFIWDNVCVEAYIACVGDNPGCTEAEACNYEAGAGVNDGSCSYDCYGCFDEAACNFSEAATLDSGDCDYSCYGCDDSGACNYNPAATIAEPCDYTCFGCMDDQACNYDASATVNIASCIYPLAELGCPCVTTYDFNSGPLGGGTGISEGFSAYSVGTLTSVVVELEFTQIDGTWVRDLAIGICDPSGNCIEMGGFDMDLGYSEAGAWPMNWYNYTDGFYEATIDVSNFGLMGEGEWSFDFVHAHSTFSDTANWEGTVELIQVCAGNPTPPLPGCNDVSACNYYSYATENDGSCVYPGDPCGDLGPCYETAVYDSNCGCTGTTTDTDGDGFCGQDDCAEGDPLIPANGNCDDIFGCTDIRACNYDPNATAEDFSCITADYWIIPGFELPGGAIPWCGDPYDLPFGYVIGNYFCVEAVVSNHSDCVSIGWNESPNAGQIDGYGFPWCESEYNSCLQLSGCIDPNACNFSPNATVDDGVCLYPGESCAEIGCSIAAVLDENCDCIVTEILDTDGDGICDFDEISGCTDAEAENFDPNATDSVNSLCEYLGCTDPDSPNYDPQANVDDGTCIVPIYGCMEVLANNYNPQANVDDGSCDYPTGCTDVLAVNFDPSAVIDDGSCDYFEVYGCTDTEACNFDPSADVDDGGCEYPETGFDCNGTCLLDADGDGICDIFEEPGCTDPLADNFEPSATDDDGSCAYDGGGVFGCTDPLADNYNPASTEDDGSCTYDGGDILGCMDQEAENFDPAATIDDGSCSYIGDAVGCTDPAACNWDEAAVEDDGTCTFPGCNDPEACNYDASAGCSDGSCTTEEHIFVPNSEATMGMPVIVWCGPLPDCSNPIIGCPIPFGFTEITHPCVELILGEFEACTGAWTDTCALQFVLCTQYPEGCMDEQACNYNPLATIDDGCDYSCLGCTDDGACNYDPTATIDDASCAFCDCGIAPKVVATGGMNQDGLNVANATLLATDGGLAQCALFNTDVLFFGFEDGPFIDMDGASDHVLALTVDSMLLAYGRNNFGQSDIPADLPQPLRFSAGHTHSVALDRQGQAYGWGDNSHGQLNWGQSSGLNGIEAGLYHTTAWNEDGSIAWAVGNNDHGQLDAPEGLVIQEMASSLHNVALTPEGEVVCWGYNDYGQCDVPSFNQPVVAVAASKRSSLALLEDGSLVLWGRLDHIEPIEEAATISGNISEDYFVVMDRNGRIHHLTNYWFMSIQGPSAVALVEARPQCTEWCLDTDLDGVCDVYDDCIGTLGDCGCECLNDDNQNGICDENETRGCLDVDAVNYNVFATLEGPCVGEEWMGQISPSACNPNDAIGAIESLTYANCGGCTDRFGCNFNPEAKWEDGTCEYSSCTGCADPHACNFNPMVPALDSCDYCECHWTEPMIDGQFGTMLSINSKGDAELSPSSWANLPSIYGRNTETTKKSNVRTGSCGINSATLIMRDSSLHVLQGIEERERLRQLYKREFSQEQELAGIDLHFRELPAEIAVPPGNDFVQVATDGTASIALREDGTVEVWGIGALQFGDWTVNGQAGNGVNLLEWAKSLENIVQVETSNFLRGVLALDANGSLHAFSSRQQFSGIPEGFDENITYMHCGSMGRGVVLREDGAHAYVLNDAEEGLNDVSDEIEQQYLGLDLLLNLGTPVQVNFEGVMSSALFDNGDVGFASSGNPDSDNEAWSTIIPASEVPGIVSIAHDLVFGVLLDSAGQGIRYDLDTTQNHLTAAWPLTANNEEPLLDAYIQSFPRRLLLGPPTDCQGCADADGDGVCNTVDNCQGEVDALGVCGGDCLLDIDNDGTCDLLNRPGCTYVESCSYLPEATWDDGSCVFSMIPIDTDFSTINESCLSDIDGNGIVATADLIFLLSEFGFVCETAEVELFDPCFDELPFDCGQPYTFHNHEYPTVQLGSLCWFQENLSALHYANGQPLFIAEGATEWSTAEQSMAAHPGWDPELTTTYGLLYNVAAISDPRGVCPWGWHVSLDTEWMDAEMNAGMSLEDAVSTGSRGEAEGIGTLFKDNSSLWNFSGGGNNLTGFTALPSGRVDQLENNNSQGASAWYWTIGDAPENPFYRTLLGGNDGVFRDNNNSNQGFSVRCVRD